MTSQRKWRGRIRVLVVDDFPVVREGLAAILEREPDLSLAGAAPDGRKALSLFAKIRPDVVLMDLRMPGMDGLEAAEALRAADREARILMISAYAGEEDIFRALKIGVRGYLLKRASAAEIVRAIRKVHAGDRVFPEEIAAKFAQRAISAGLTCREVQILDLVASGNSNKEIGVRLDLAEGTVKVHVSNILRKMGAKDRTQASTLAIRNGLVRLR